MKFLIRIIFASIVTGALGACNYTHFKDGGNSNEQPFGKLDPNEKLTMMNYEFISSQVLGPRCATCHGSSGNVNLETFESVISNLAAIQRTVFQEQIMPKRGVLTADEKRLLWNWIALGAPKESEGPPPESDPIVPT